MTLHFTSGYHPEGDGQTEHTNQTLKQYLCIFCNYQQDNWNTLLPLAEFAYNNTPSATTGTPPFFANKGYHPNLTIHLELLGDALTSSLFGSMLIPYLDLTLSYSPIAPPVRATES